MPHGRSFSLRPAASVAALLAGACLWAAPSTAAAYTLRETPDGRPVRWPVQHIDLRVDHRLARQDTDNVHSAADAARAWSGLFGVPTISITGEAHDEPGWTGPAGEHGVYSVEEWAYGRALAVTVTTARESDGAILDADVLVQRSERIRRAEREDEDAGDFADFDLQSILTHEFGHVLGLGESDVQDATMFPTTRAGDLSHRSLAPDDEQGAQVVYEGARRVGVASCAARPAHRGSVLGLALVGVGLVVLRRRGALARRGFVLVGGVALAGLLAAGDPPEGHAVPVDLLGDDAVLVHVREARTVVRGGLFTTVIRDGDRTFRVPGGRSDGLVQIVGDEPPPDVGETVVVSGAGWAETDGENVWGGSIGLAPTLLPARLRASATLDR